MKCVPKLNGKLRLVVDCRHVNNSIKCDKFSQEGIEAVANQIQQDDELVSVDLKNGFHHVPVETKFHKYLAIQWQGRFYVWQVLPFGVKCALYYFNKILRPVIAYLRQEGLRSALFVDDFFLMSRPHLMETQKDHLILTLQQLAGR